LAALREASVVIHLEQTEPREALLEQFLSQVPLGRSTYGVEAASRAWYGKSASDLEIGQAAHLAALMLKGGGGDSSERGRNQILAQLYEAGLITQKELAFQRTIPLKNLLIPVSEETPVNSLVPDAGLLPYLERIYSQLVERYGSAPVAKGQIEVDSTLDLGAQEIVATIVQKAAGARGLSEVVVVLLDDRSQVRVMYATDGSVAEEARIDSEEALKPFWRWESFRRSLNWSDQITALELAQGHALVARDGRRYETQTVLEIRNADGTRIDRGNDQTEVLLDTQTASQITELLTEVVARDLGFGAQLDDVAGIPGVNTDRDLAWFGGSTARFSIGLWMSVTSGAGAGNAQFDLDETAAARLAGEVLRELHRDG
jgi:membrane peptidoglycan carboxypeptidase